MLYLHGFRSGIGGRISPTKERVLEMNLADGMIALDAPFVVASGGRKWFTLPEEGTDADIFEEMKESADYILKEIRGLGIDIIVGASQGGFMALYLTLNGIIRPKRTVALVPFYLPGLVGEIKNRETPILWIAGGKDEVVPKEVAGTWRDLQAAGANLDYCLEPESAHLAETWMPEFCNEIMAWVKKQAI